MMLDPFEDLASVFGIMTFLFLTTKSLCILDWFHISRSSKLTKPYLHYTLQSAGIGFIGFVSLIFIANITIMMWQPRVLPVALLLVAELVLFMTCCVLTFKEVKEGRRRRKNSCRSNYFLPIPPIKHPVESYSLKTAIELPFVPYYTPN
eukprot:TRINITY_DN7502_c0_g1_i15.p2 TRINITY_DN7502_c0_g1~~TRINITY_DN7502_c0_g1_i15.p2  ORF type:complete len:149 (-),score=10.12 TRINITY_DN7502_c0_g1_i15:59-505(-)